MRKFILITAMVLASATAQAGPMRGLTLASNEPPAVARGAETQAQKSLRPPVKRLFMSRGPLPSVR